LRRSLRARGLRDPRESRKPSGEPRRACFRCSSMPRGYRERIYLATSRERERRIITRADNAKQSVFSCSLARCIIMTLLLNSRRKKRARRSFKFRQSDADGKKEEPIKFLERGHFVRKTPREKSEKIKSRKSLPVIRLKRINVHIFYVRPGFT